MDRAFCAPAGDGALGFSTAANLVSVNRFGLRRVRLRRHGQRGCGGAWSRARKAFP